MSLTLGKQFDRNYNLRIPFLNTFYNIYVYFSKKSPLVLYNIDQDSKSEIDKSVSIRMFKNLTGSVFCDTFLNLHDYRKNNLDIVNQFHDVKSEFSSDILFVCNESINLTKVDVGDRVLFDTITIYGFTLASYINEYVFVVTERQHINQNLNKKIVRTTGIELGTNESLEFIKDINNRVKNDGVLGINNKEDKSNQTLKLS